MSETPDPGPAPASPSIGPPPGAMKLMVVNVSATIEDDEFNRTVAAVQAQVNADFEPIWRVGAALVASRQDLAGAKVDVDDASQAIVYVGDSTVDPKRGLKDAFGYHDKTHGALPYAFVYLDVCKLRDEPWSCTLSHEVLELLADPNTELTADGPWPADTGIDGQAPYSLEVCDPTQRDYYPVGEIMVSNFVTRAYFGEGAAGDATNYMGLDLAPFGVRPGGYTQYDDGVRLQRIDGSAVDQGFLRAQALMAGHRRNARRDAARGLRGAGR